jgi:predicted O-methyltransferase YrrM
MPKYTYDTFTKNIPIWEKVLDQPYKDYLNTNRVNILDIGAGEGIATTYLAQTFAENIYTKIYSIDGWWQKEVEKNFDANMVEAQISHKIIKIKGSVIHTLCDLATRNNGNTGWAKFNIIHYNYTTQGTEALNILMNAFNLLLKEDGVLLINNYDTKQKSNILGSQTLLYKL